MNQEPNMSGEMRKDEIPEREMMEINGVIVDVTGMKAEEKRELLNAHQKENN